MSNQLHSGPNTTAKQPNEQFSKTAKGSKIYLEQYNGAIEAAAETVYEKRLYDPLHEAILLEFGVGRSGFFRSKEVNSFRNIMKKTARDTSYNEIDETASKTQDSMLQKLYNTNLAKKEAYASSKKNVDATMSMKADSIISSVASRNGVIFDMIVDIIPTLDKTKKQEKIVKDFTDSADKYAKKLEPPKKLEAIEQAQTIVQKVIEEDSQGKFQELEKLKNDNSSEASKLVLNVSNNTKGVGDQAYKKVTAIKDENVFSAFAKAAQIVKQVVPNDGDSADASFEISIPLTPFAAIVFNIGASCEHGKEDVDDGTGAGTTREQDYYTVGAEINIGASGKISGLFAEAVLKGTLGLFVEAQGRRPEDALTLISYGIYRVLFTKSESLASSIWGNGGKTGFSKFEEAEIWASMIEKNILEDENTSVSVGAQAGFSAEAKTTDKYNEVFKTILAVKGEGELKGQKYYQYSKKIIEEAGLESPAALEDILKNLEDDPRMRKLIVPPGAVPQPGQVPNPHAGKQFKDVLEARRTKFKDNIHHKTKLSLSASTEFSFAKKAGFGCGIEGGITLNHSGNSRDANAQAQKNLRKIQIEAIEFGINLKFPEGVDDLDAFNQILPKVSDYAAAIIGNTVNKASTDSENVGVVAGREAALNVVNTSLQSYVSTLKLDKTPFEDSWGSELSAGLNFEFNLLENENKIELEITRAQSHSFDFEVVNFSVEKSKTLFSKRLL